MTWPGAALAALLYLSLLCLGYGLSQVPEERPAQWAVFLGANGLGIAAAYLAVGLLAGG